MRLHTKIIVAAVTVGGLALAAAALHWWPPQRFTTLDKLQWKIAPPLIYVNGEQREERQGLLIIRTKDAKEQFVAGNWKANYAADGGLLAYGHFPTGYASTAGQHLYFIQSNGVQGTGLDKVTDAVVSAHLNANQAYLLIETATVAGRDFCVLEWKSSLTPDCLRVQEERLAAAEWDLTSDHQFAARTAGGKLLLVDMWENGLTSPKTVTAEADPDLYRRLSKLLAGPADSPGSLAAAGRSSFRPFMFFLFVKDSHGWSVHRRPLGSTWGWLADDDHLLVKQRNALGIYEVSSRSYAPLLNEQAVGDKTVGYRNGIDRGL